MTFTFLEYTESSICYIGLWDAVLKNYLDESREGSRLCPNVTESATTELNKFMKMKRIDIK